MPNRPLRIAESAILLVSELAGCAEEWIQDAQLRGDSPQTINARRFLTGKLLWFLRSRELPHCDTAAVRAFFAHVQMGHEEPGGRWGNPRLTKKVRPRTAETYFKNLSIFFRWCVEDGKLEQSPMETLRAPIARPDQIQPFTEEQVLALLAAAKRTRYPKRDTALLLLLLDTGVRASEACALIVGDLDLAGHRCTVLGKGNKRRSVYFGRETSRALWAHIKSQEAEEDHPLFAGEGGRAEPLTRSGLLQWMERLGKSAGLKNVRCSPHTARHTAAWAFIKQGGSPLALQILLGHTTPAQTAKYVKLADADLQSQHRAHSPMDALVKKKRQP